MKLEGESVIIENVFDNDVSNDVFIVNPGKLVLSKASDFKRVGMNLYGVGVKSVSGKGAVKLVHYDNGHMRLTVDGSPYVIRAVSYSPSRVGLSPDFGTLDNLRDWSFDDYNNNRKPDGPYEAVVDDYEIGRASCRERV